MQVYGLQRGRFWPALLLILTLTACSPVSTASPTSATQSLPSSPTLSTQMRPTSAVASPAPTLLPEYYPFECPAEQSGNTWGVYLTDVSGEKIQRLTPEDANYRYPKFSPDGRHIAFVRFCEPTGALMLYNRQSKQPIAVSEEKGVYGKPAWSTDSNYLAFTWTSGGRSQLFVYEPDIQRLTTILDWNGQLFSPTWSPTNEKLAFAAETDGEYEIWSINIDGSELTQLTKTGGRAFAPSWSPTEDVLAYVNLNSLPPAPLEENLSDASLHLMTPVSAESCPITLTKWTQSHPVWSPDGQWVTSGGVTGISVINQAGLTKTVVITGAASFEPQSWSLNGTKLVFDASGCCLRDIVIVDLSDLRRSHPFGARFNGTIFWQQDAT